MDTIKGVIIPCNSFVSLTSNFHGQETKSASGAKTKAKKKEYIYNKKQEIKCWCFLFLSSFYSVPLVFLPARSSRSLLCYLTVPSGKNRNEQQALQSASQNSCRSNSPKLHSAVLFFFPKWPLLRMQANVTWNATTARSAPRQRQQIGTET